MEITDVMKLNWEPLPERRWEDVLVRNTRRFPFLTRKSRVYSKDINIFVASLIYEVSEAFEVPDFQIDGLIRKANSSFFQYLTTYSCFDVGSELFTLMKQIFKLPILPADEEDKVATCCQMFNALSPEEQVQFFDSIGHKEDLSKDSSDLPFNFNFD